MVVVAPFMWRHRFSTLSGEQANRFRRVCSCGWKSLPYEPDNAGRSAAALEVEHHAATVGLLHLRWEIV